MPVPLISQILSDICLIPDFYAEVPVIYADICFFCFHCSVNVCGWVRVIRLRSIANDGIGAMRGQGGGGWGNVGGYYFCASVRAKLLWRPIYCANPRPDRKSQSRSWSVEGMGRKAPRIMHEYDLAIVIRPLTHLRTCEMGSLIFPPWVNWNSREWIDPPSRECHQVRGQTEKRSISRGSSYCTCNFFLPPTIQELIHWFNLLGISISIAESDVDDGVSLDTPKTSD